MRSLLLCFAIIQLACCSCPDIGGFELVKDGECRGLHSQDQSLFDSAVSQAIKRCESIDGKPVIVHNQEHQSYWMDRAPPTSDGFLIMGLVCNTNTKQWEWSDGTALDFKPPAGKYNIELDRECTEGFAWDLHPDGYWSYGSSGYLNALYFCTTQLQQEAPGADGCDNFADDSDDGICYQVGATSESWQDAEMTCIQYGAHLASIHNKNENAFIRRLAVSKGATNGLFIGGSAKKDGSFGWIDGTEMDYTNYYPGFPKKNFGDCVAMDTTETSGQWMNIDCATKLPVACIRPQHTVEEPVCTGEDYKESAIITSPGYPFSSSTTCDYFLTVPSGKKVQVEILSLEANTCCDHLILYDGYLGAPKIAELSGELQNKTYTASSNIMRVSWQPDGGVNVKGLAMTYREV